MQFFAGSAEACNERGGGEMSTQISTTIPVLVGRPHYNPMIAVPDTQTFLKQGCAQQKDFRQASSRGKQCRVVGVQAIGPLTRMPARSFESGFFRLSAPDADSC
jgi:hypothetical protein